MSVEVIYSFYYDDYPRVNAITVLDGQEISSISINIEKSYDQLSTQNLKDFSAFLLDEFNKKIQELLDNNLNSDVYQKLLQPIGNICKLKTGCDQVIYNRENPPTNENPFPSSLQEP